MAELVILGSANSIPSAAHANTHMAIVGEAETVLIDCVGTALVRLQRAGIQPDDIQDLILTHFHPDHVSGVPLLLMNMWLMGRKAPLRIYGLNHCLKRIEDTMGFYQWENWPEFFKVSFHRLPETEGELVLENDDVRIYSSPVHHLVPTVGLRIEGATSGRRIAYSCDTEPCDEVARLAAGADVLIHEATGRSPGHSSADQAGEIAALAEVGRLLLIHYPVYPGVDPHLVSEARTRFQGPVELAEDFMRLPLDGASG
jgi:ribonuclease Z